MASRRGRSGDEISRPIKVEIVDVEKVKGLSKYYLYIVKVLCNDGNSYYIYRRYRQFDELHNALEKRFPIEAGAIRITDRTLPTLPNCAGDAIHAVPWEVDLGGSETNAHGPCYCLIHSFYEEYIVHISLDKVYVRRSAVREVADKRLPLLNEYLKTLFELPDKIRYDSIVNAFTNQTSDDLAKPYYGNQAYKSRPSGSIKPTRPARPPTKPTKPALPPFMQKPGAKVGPRPPLPPPPLSSIATTKRTSALPKLAPPTRPNVGPGGKVVKGPRAKTIYPYAAQQHDELSFPEGVFIGLVRQADSDWWEGQYEGKTGLVPGNYIDIIQAPVRVDTRDQISSSDEWDSSDNDEERGKLTYYFNDAPRTVDVDLNIVRNPNKLLLLRAIQTHLRKTNIVLNYKDQDGDLIEICDRDDIEMMKTDATPPRKLLPGNCHAPWAIYVTLQGDHSPYNTELPGLPRRAR